MAHGWSRTLKDCLVCLFFSTIKKKYIVCVVRGVCFYITKINFLHSVGILYHIKRYFTSIRMKKKILCALVSKRKGEQKKLRTECGNKISQSGGVCWGVWWPQLYGKKMTLTKYIIQHIQYTLLFNPWIIDIIETRGKNNILKSSHEHTHTLDCRTSRYAWKRIVNFRGFRDKRKQAIHTTPRIRTWGVEQFYRFFFFRF